MELAPFGVLTDGHQRLLRGSYRDPMVEWRGTPVEFGTLMDTWIAEVAEKLWPARNGTSWVGKAAPDMIAATRAELELAVTLYHGSAGRPRTLDEVPADIPEPPDHRPRTHLWHYEIEDGRILDPKFLYPECAEGKQLSYDFRASRDIGSNYLVYEPGIDITRFEKLFWGRMRGLQPAIFDIKQHFQRPRPWMAAAALNVQGFRWTTADGQTHTGLHPAILSGHSIQGILGGCSVLDALLEQAKESGEGPSGAMLDVLSRYMVDWGDRRVFAGVHFMTDNIASWTLARRLIPKLFHHAQQIETFAVQAITRRSRVFADIVKHFAGKQELKPALGMLGADFPEAAAVS
jgi:hypothetical protein